MRQPAASNEIPFEFGDYVDVGNHLYLYCNRNIVYLALPFICKQSYAAAGPH
jgi:hypothetical protein